MAATILVIVDVLWAQYEGRETIDVSCVTHKDWEMWGKVGRMANNGLSRALK